MTINDNRIRTSNFPSSCRFRRSERRLQRNNNRSKSYKSRSKLVIHLAYTLQGGPKNGDPDLFGDNFGNSAPILTILPLLQAEIYGA